MSNNYAWSRRANENSEYRATTSYEETTPDIEYYSTRYNTPTIYNDGKLSITME
jgi:hypothetical protein